MAVRANLIVGAIGAVLALGSGSVIALNWEDLVGLETWQATFETSQVRLPERSASLAPAGTRTEVFDVRTPNMTYASIDVTWSDPAFNSPEVTLRVLDPSRKVRLEESHTGGASGIHLRLELIDPDDVPREPATFRVREDLLDVNARNAFETRWPTHHEAVGNWTFELRSAAPSGPAPSGNIVYDLRVQYEFYAGTFARVPEPMR